VSVGIDNIMSGKAAIDVTKREPAVPIKKSITPDYLVCLEDGQKLKMLKRYLRGRYKMSPDEYRAKWGLPADYPMVAPNYAAIRSQFAKDNGLGKTRPAAKAKKR
jgi:predicted transcriptional regulator